MGTLTHHPILNGAFWTNVKSMMVMSASCLKRSEQERARIRQTAKSQHPAFCLLPSASSCLLRLWNGGSTHHKPEQSDAPKDQRDASGPQRPTEQAVNVNVSKKKEKKKKEKQEKEKSVPGSFAPARAPLPPLHPSTHPLTRYYTHKSHRR